MCGPLAVALSASAPAGSPLLRRQLAFSLGRLFTYGFCGAVAGYAGAWLATGSRGFLLSQAWLAILAGLALVVLGLISSGVLPKPTIRLLTGLPCGTTTWLKTFLTSPGWSGPWLAGVFTGFIPCGLVYAFLLKAGSAGSLWLGWLTMVVFGLGTVPLMVLVGYSGRFFSVASRTRLFQMAAWCIVLTGVISVARGAAQLDAPSLAEPAACPFCESE
jgi:sulfite exporter TauE/SafE